MIYDKWYDNMVIIDFNRHTMIHNEWYDNSVEVDLKPNKNTWVLVEENMNFILSIHVGPSY